MATELQQLTAMLTKAHIGHGLRTDYNPPGTAVLVEHPHDDSETAFTVTEWSFDGAGALKKVAMYPGDVG